MSTKTATGTKYVYRYFHAESGIALTAGEARKLPGRLVVVETLRVPGINKKPDVSKPVLHNTQAKQSHTILYHFKHTVIVYFNRLKRQLALLRENKKSHGLFEVKSPLVESLAPRFPFAVTHEVNSPMANADPK